MNVHVSRNGKVIGEFSEEDFRKNVRIGVIAPSDYYFCEGFTDWKSVADFKRKQALLGFTPPKTIAGQIGALLVVSWFMPMIHPVFLIFTIALAIAAFVVAIMEIVKSRLTGGILLVVGCILTPFMIVAVLSAKTVTTQSSRASRGDCIDSATSKAALDFAAGELDDAVIAQKTGETAKAVSDIRDAASSLRTAAIASRADPAVSEPLKNAASEYEEAASALENGDETTSANHARAAIAAVKTSTAALRQTSVPRCR
jgi:hypothetical protein